MIKFTKMHGLGNDYIYIDCTTKDLPQDISKIAIKMSDRNFGIGSDGVILICKSNVADFKMRIFNSDGTEAQMCGNGIRCVGKYVYEKGLTNKTNLSIETLAGIKKLKLNLKNGYIYNISVDMGKPILNAENIPVIYEKEFVKDLKINAMGKEFIFTCVSIGNPHAVCFLNEIDSLNLEKYGNILENDFHFPQKSNIEFIKIIDRNNIKMRVWERGAKETLACGTGACASVVASTINNYTNRTVNVHLKGGRLLVNWNKFDNHIYMVGSATTVFEGEYLQ